MEVVLDDAVVDHGDGPLLVRVGMAVELGGRAVRRPPGMPQADAALQRVPAQLFGEAFEPSLAFDDVHFALPVQHGDSGGIIAPVLQLFEAAHQDGLGLLVTDVADDTTHV